jgi:hypothetical protein
MQNPSTRREQKRSRNKTSEPEPFCMFINQDRKSAPHIFIVSLSAADSKPFHAGHTIETVIRLPAVTAEQTVL